MDIVNTLLSVIVLVNLMLVVVSCSGYKKSQDESFAHLLYLINILSIIWWVSCMILNRSSEVGSVLVTSKHLYVSATTIASSFYYFSLIFPKSPRRYTRELFGLVFLNAGIIALVVFSNGIIYSAEKLSSGEVLIHFGQYYFLYVIYIFALFGISFFRFYFKYSRNKEEKQKGQLFWLFLGYTTSGIFSFVADIIMPFIYDSKYCWVGPASTIFLATSVTYAVKKHSLFNIKVITTEIFVLFLWILTLIKISSFEQQEAPLISAIFLVIFILIGILLIKSVKKQAEQYEENKRLVLELANANRQLKEVDEIKSKFVSLARHQMASPLTAINAYASLLNDKDVNLDKIGLKSLQGIIDRFVVIVKDFLAISQIENNEINYKKEEVDLLDILNEVLCERRFIIDHHNIDVQMDFDDVGYKIKGDRVKLSTAFANVLENSIQYSNDSNIIITFDKKDEEIILTISDKGHRSLPEITEKLLEKFSNSGDQYEASIMGNGLGVYVAKRFIEAHGGNFKINHRKNITDFVITLPV